MGVVIEPPSFDEGVQIGRERRNPIAGDEFREVVGVCADVADRSGGT